MADGVDMDGCEVMREHATIAEHCLPAPPRPGTAPPAPRLMGAVIFGSMLWMWDIRAVPVPIPR